MTHPRDRIRGPQESLLGPRIIAVAVLALGAMVVIVGLQIPRGGGYAAVGPGAFPIVVGAGILLLGLILVLRTTVIPDHDLARRVAAEEAATNWPDVGFVALALVAYALLLKPLGYVVATAVFLPVAARILGGRRPVRDLLAGIAFAFVLYYGFTRFLGVRLPDGVLAPFL